MHLDNVCDWQAFLLGSPNIFWYKALVPECLVPITQAEDTARLKMGTVQCLSFWSWLSRYHVWGMNTVGCQSSKWAQLEVLIWPICQPVEVVCLFWEQPCCVMRLVTQNKVRTLVILMCNNSSNNRPGQLVRKWGKITNNVALQSKLLATYYFKAACKNVRYQQVSDQLYRHMSLSPVSSLKSNILHMLLFLLRDGLQHSHKPAH